MSLKLLDRLLFAQGQSCFFCNKQLAKAEASVEHLLAKSHGGSNDPENCVACCQSLNSLFGSISLKAKMEIVLRQRGDFHCPQTLARPETSTAPATRQPARFSAEQVTAVITDLEKRGSSKPRTLERLLNTVEARLQKQLDRQAVQSLVEHLRCEGVVLVEADERVSYVLLDRSA